MEGKENNMGTTLIDEPGKTPKREGTSLVDSPTGTGTKLVEPLGNKATESAAESAGESDSPVVGWLVIIDGPGRGKSIEMGFGMNIIGRSKSNRIALDYGDTQISGEDHFRIAYDGQNSNFHLIPGRGTNLVYVGGSPLLNPTELTAGAEMTVGSTTMRFVPLCTDEWNWGN